MREYHRNPFDPGIPLTYQGLDDRGINSPEGRLGEIDLGRAQLHIGGSRSGWEEAVSFPFPEHPRSPSHQSIRYTPRPESVVNSPFRPRLNSFTPHAQWSPGIGASPVSAAFVDPEDSDRGSGVVENFQHGIPFEDGDSPSAVQDHGVAGQRGLKLPPIRSGSGHQDTQLPGIHQILGLPMIHPKTASAHCRKHQEGPLLKAETLFVDGRSKRTHKRGRGSFEAPDAPYKAGLVCRSTPAFLTQMSPTQDMMQSNDMEPPPPPPPKRPYRLPRGMFGIPCRPPGVPPPPKTPIAEPQRVPLPPKTPIAESAQDNIQPAQSPRTQPPESPRDIGANSQAKLIVKLASRSASHITRRPHEVFSEEQCQKMLWLALHGVSRPTIARLLYNDIDKSKPFSNKTELVAGIDKLVRLFIAELALGQDRTSGVDDMVEHLLQEGDRLDWSPYLLRQAVGVMSTSGDEATQSQEVREVALERHALSKWRSTHGGENPFQPSLGSTRRNQMQAFRGLMRESVERKMMEQLGYREDNHDVERALMKKWLLRIRELGKLPDRLMEAELEAHSSSPGDAHKSSEHKMPL
ncbi:hypothetical protein Z517_08656 [Fonsecaea pedrosoi CBS 271.37]|uniref:Uncharacterized protein n=1 Tax=Fonsecaea pedrosoi CBS 271.37 TaxID=1442368 RepID=A0A0D2EXA1_9EURO|nr:uncharacterized protein Z517_08656 [Fonsecaea pedrosoi CBS 271.37]KIW78817.1 hypothetical protein Z517_08656 [Fonsecaea pedrosoi CBS 271.37]